MADDQVDAYLEQLDEPKRSTLASLRQTLLELVPGAEECLSYGVPAIRRDGKLVAGYSAAKGHLSYLPHSGSVLESLPEVTAAYETSKGALRFPVDTPLPREVVAALVSARLADIDAAGGSGAHGPG